MAQRRMLETKAHRPRSRGKHPSKPSEADVVSETIKRMLDPGDKNGKD